MEFPATGTLLLLGDVHGDFAMIAAQIAHALDLARDRPGTEPVGVVVAGDLGLFGPELDRFFRRGGHRFRLPVAFIEGNHEDFREFPGLVAGYADVLTYLPRATVRRLGPWRALCLGGARYMDSWSTPRGCEVTEQDIKACLALAADSVDLVVSHDCPCGIGVPGAVGFEHLGPPGVPGFERVAAGLKPQLWFFGHHHRWHDHVKGDTRYIGLPESRHGYCLVDAQGAVGGGDHEFGASPRSGWWRLPTRR